jgi:hypothetical protein
MAMVTLSAMKDFFRFCQFISWDASFINRPPSFNLHNKLWAPLNLPPPSPCAHQTLSKVPRGPKGTRSAALHTTVRTRWFYGRWKLGLRIARACIYSSRVWLGSELPDFDERCQASQGLTRLCQASLLFTRLSLSHLASPGFA